uniref:Uncharacterized protein n=2 Tax=Cercopithecinae TaxID=9528 RepID=A0A2K5XNB7_MANLE|nr:unnamed protein product [Macaca fascicularis]
MLETGSDIFNGSFSSDLYYSSVRWLYRAIPPGLTASIIPMFPYSPPYLSICLLYAQEYSKVAQWHEE